MLDDAVELAIDPRQARPDQGFCWIVDLPAQAAHGDDLDNPARSELQLFEDSTPLGPAHADHHRIRVVGGGLYSHWKRQLYFSTSDNIAPAASRRKIRVRVPRIVADGNSDTGSAERNPSLIDAIAPQLRQLAQGMSLDMLAKGPTSSEQRIEILERKVEYLLDELYAAKSQLRHLTPMSQTLGKLRSYQISTFDFQWSHLPYHDAFLSNPEWRHKAADDLCARLDRPPEWLRDKSVLDCGCGPGRHTWTFASLGARVTAFDTSDAAVEMARRETGMFDRVTIERRSILDALPYGPEFDLVWCYGVIHHTGDAYRALANIAACVRPGGLIYLMVYPEPERTNADAYRYYHEVYVLRRLTRHLTFEQKAELLKHVQGERWALSWFDAISSEINDLFTMEELTQMLTWLGFSDIRRTMPHEHSLNVTAIRRNG